MVLNTGLPFIPDPVCDLRSVKRWYRVPVQSLSLPLQLLCAPIAASLGLDPIPIFLASGAGARLCCHVNDSYFWYTQTVWDMI